MFLLGPHSPLRRQLAFKFCQLTNRECEYVALTADTSEADLKSRRELRRVNGSNGQSEKLSVVWSDQAVVRAAIHGRVLVLEGLEKAERNVLPVLNNLLENREMQLEDGRFLVAPARYDSLVKQGRFSSGSSGNSQGDDDQRLVRVHEAFRVITVGVPSPPFPGNPLDPPLRSRFQARHIARVPTTSLVSAIQKSTNSTPQLQERITHLLSLYEAIWVLGDQQGKQKI